MNPHGGASRSRSEPVSGRRHELDWLRALIILGLIPFHAVGIFTAVTASYLETTAASPIVDALVELINIWGTPLLFLVAGASAWFALSVRSGGMYLRERVTRLLIPFAFATLVIIPFQVYFGLLTQPNLLNLRLVPISDPHLLDSFARFYPQYLGGYFYFLTHFAPPLKIIFWGHLWFIPRLLILAVVSLPLFLALRAPSGRPVLARLTRLIARPGAIVLLGIVPAVSEVLFEPSSINPFHIGWNASDELAQTIFALLFFVFGFVLYSDAHCVETVKRQGIAILLLGIVVWGLSQALFDGGKDIPAAQFAPDRVIALMMRGLIAWLWAIGLLGLGIRFFSFTNRLLAYLSEASYPLYVIHLPILIMLNSVVIHWDAGIPVKLAVLIAGTFAGALALYELLIKRTRVTRFVFGMRLQREGKPSVPLEQPRAGIPA